MSAELSALLRGSALLLLMPAAAGLSIFSKIFEK
jgi:hypothetical protein